MDKHDEEFEGFLRQFRLRSPGPLHEVTSRSRWINRWILVVAAAVLAVPLAILLFRSLAGTGGPYATVEIAGYSPYKVGEKIGAGRAVRSSSVDSAVLALEDGSHIEMRSESELVLQNAVDGVRVLLNSGSIIVSPSGQHTGHLYVQSRDATASVFGAVCFVSVEPGGTRVAAIQGDVHVEYGSTSRELRSGEEFVTAASMEPRLLAKEIGWSRNAAAHLAMLQPPGTVQEEAPVRSERPSPRSEPPAGPVLARQNPDSSPPPGQAQQPVSPPEQPQQSAKASDVAGREILGRACSLCHLSDVVSTQHFPTKEGYAALVSGEVAKGAPVSNEDFPILVDYLFDNFGKKPVAPGDPPK
jgi:hypothetical protein